MRPGSDPALQCSAWGSAAAPRASPASPSRALPLPPHLPARVSSPSSWRHLLGRVDACGARPAQPQRPRWELRRGVAQMGRGLRWGGSEKSCETLGGLRRVGAGTHTHSLPLSLSVVHTGRSWGRTAPLWQQEALHGAHSTTQSLRPWQECSSLSHVLYGDPEAWVRAEPGEPWTPCSAPQVSGDSLSLVLGALGSRPNNHPPLP